MPLKDVKKKLNILDDLNLFVEKLLNRIADESSEGCAQLIKVIETAKGRYNKPIESWVSGWFYQFSRVRGSEVDLAIKSMGEFPDAYTRLQEFKLLVGKGEWNVGSFNYYLFDELIKSVPDYRPLTDDVRLPIILRVSELIKERIDVFMNGYMANRKLIESREKELQTTQQSIKKTLDNVLIAHNVETATSSAVANPNKIQFSLTMQKGIWKLHWVDILGKAYAIEPGEELIETLLNHKSHDLNTLNPVSKMRLKKECVKARDMFLDRVQVLVNPKDPRTNEEMSNKDLVGKEVLSTFILRGKKGEYSLCWINSLGNDANISLDGYTRLNTWLNEQNSLTEDHIPQLKAYLLYVKTSNTLGMDDFKETLKNCLSRKPAQTKNDIVAPDANDKNKVESTPRKKLDYSGLGPVLEFLKSLPNKNNKLQASLALKNNSADTSPVEPDVNENNISKVESTPRKKLDYSGLGPVLEFLKKRPKARADSASVEPVENPAVDSISEQATQGATLSASRPAPGKLNLKLFPEVTRSFNHKIKNDEEELLGLQCSPGINK